MNNYHNYYITIIIIIFSIYEVHNSFFQDKKNSFFFSQIFFSTCNVRHRRIGVE